MGFLAFTAGKVAVYFCFFLLVGRWLGVHGSGRPWMGTWHRFWLGLVATAIVIGQRIACTMVLDRWTSGERAEIVTDYLTAGFIWIFRAGIWWFSLRMAYPVLVDRKGTLWICIVLGLSLNILLDVFLWTTFRVGRGFIFPSIGRWEISFC